MFPWFTEVIQDLAKKAMDNDNIFVPNDSFKDLTKARQKNALDTPRYMLTILRIYLKNQIREQLIAKFVQLKDKEEYRLQTKKPLI